MLYQTQKQLGLYARSEDGINTGGDSLSRAPPTLVTFRRIYFEILVSTVPRCHGGGSAVPRSSDPGSVCGGSCSFGSFPVSSCGRCYPRAPAWSPPSPRCLRSPSPRPDNRLPLPASPTVDTGRDVRPAQATCTLWAPVPPTSEKQDGHWNWYRWRSWRSSEDTSRPSKTWEGNFSHQTPPPTFSFSSTCTTKSLFDIRPPCGTPPNANSPRGLCLFDIDKGG